MPKYNVHVYREMRLRFDGVEADSPEEAALAARELSLEVAGEIDECDGETYSALVDVAGDEDFSRSRMIDFGPERLRKAAPELLQACRWMMRELCAAWDEPDAKAIPERFRAVIDSAEQEAGTKHAPAHPLLVAPGTPLQEGRLYLHLFHGRDHPDQQMDDWGFDGPLFGPLSAVHQTYSADYRLYGVDGRLELWLARHEDMVAWAGRYYGDVAVFVASPGKAA